MSPSYGNQLLHIDNVSLSYGDKVVLRDVNAQIRDIIVPGKVVGQIVGFLGPSGIGKTTLFQILAGLLKPTVGSVHLDGSTDTVKPGQVGVVAQSYPLFEHRTVLSNLMLAAQQKEKNTKLCHDKVIEYLQEFDLTEQLNHYPIQLSGGQRQRVAILQQILSSKHFLLMDEPFSGLDLLMIEKTSALIRKVADMDDLNTIIICTHDITSAASVADHLWMMGRERTANGDIIPGAKIVKEYDLIARDLCWHPEIITQARFTDFVREVKEEFRKL